ncbi:battenin-like isoform X2 [Anneissia japonica]|uniref:battenin-like isoform X2 n=1 Tax=Anneissia japonica TaxID=1529436 RepID=UPI0014256F7D|nr:battenin-like isoform X2 [Anneissia japonica]
MATADTYSRRNWVGFFILGLITFLPYTVVNCASRDIAKNFDKENLIGTIFGANISASIIMKLLNTFVLLRVPYGIRFFINGIIMGLGVCGLAYASKFAFALSSVVFVGASAAFGENIALGYLSRYDSRLVNAWSSGTGFAGLVGSGLYVIFGCAAILKGKEKNLIHTLDKYAFLSMVPAIALYWVAYLYIIQQAGNPRTLREYQASATENHSAINGRVKQGHRPSLDTTNAILYHQCDSETSSTTTTDTSFLESWHEQIRPTVRRTFICLKKILWLAVNLCLCTFCEYMIRISSSRVRNIKEYDKTCPELYASMQLCYQAAMFSSRSSAQILPIRKIGILTFIQVVNMLVWVIDIKYKYLPVSVLPAYMIVVGLLGGAVYVNVFYMLMHDPKYPREDRDLCTNIAAIFITMGISFSCITLTALFNSVLKEEKSGLF